MTEPATMLRHLSVDECWQAVRRSNVGRLAVIHGHRPDIFPVNYVVDDEDRIVVRTAEGSKLAAAIASGSVAFEVDETDPASRTGWSVVIHGEAREPRSIDALMRDQSLDLDPWAGASDKMRFIEITPMQVTGRSVGPRPGDARDS